PGPNPWKSRVSRTRTVRTAEWRTYMPAPAPATGTMWTTWQTVTKLMSIGRERNRKTARKANGPTLGEPENLKASRAEEHTRANGPKTGALPSMWTGNTVCRKVNTAGRVRAPAPTLLNTSWLSVGLATHLPARTRSAARQHRGQRSLWL